MGKKIAKVLGFQAPKPPKVQPAPPPPKPKAEPPKVDTPAEIPDQDVVQLNAAAEEAKRRRTGRSATLLSDNDYLG